MKSAFSRIPRCPLYRSLLSTCPQVHQEFHSMPSVTIRRCFFSALQPTYLPVSPCNSRFQSISATSAPSPSPAPRGPDRRSLARSCVGASERARAPASERRTLAGREIIELALLDLGELLTWIGEGGGEKQRKKASLPSIRE